jgi:hypothetical protein
MTTTASTDRGRHAERPSEIPARGWKDILYRTKDEIGDDHVTMVAASVAFAPQRAGTDRRRDARQRWAIECIVDLGDYSGRIHSEG